MLVLILLMGGVVLAAPTRADEANSKLTRLEGDPAMAKVSSRLLKIRRLVREGGSPAEIRASAPLVGFQNDRPEIEVRLRKLTPTIVAEVRRIGMRVTGVHYAYARIVGSCAPELLDEIAAIPEVTTIHPNYRPTARTGSVTSQGDASILADVARLDFGVDGTGVQVGIPTNSFHATPSVGGSVTGTGCSRTLTGSLPQSSGDLPAAVTILDNCDSGGATCSNLDDEGAAMAEIVHDLAPGAAILFHSAFNSEADFAQGITELAACGADIIVDDVLWFAEPMFQDGIVAQTVESTVAGGVSYFSAAGNDAGISVDEIYVDADPGTDDEIFPPSGADLHDFRGDNRFGEITIPDGCGVNLVLQWNEPYSGTLGAGSSRDLDLYLCSSDSLAVSQGSLVACNQTGALAFSDDSQGCGGIDPPFGDPFEILSYVNTSGTDVTAHVAVEHFCGSQDDLRFRIVASTLDCSETNPGYSFEGPGIFDKSPIYGHPASTSANTVGAVFYGEIDTGGNEEPPMGQINVFPTSSKGGDLPFYFDDGGNPLPGAAGGPGATVPAERTQNKNLDAWTGNVPDTWEIAEGGGSIAETTDGHTGSAARLSRTGPGSVFIGKRTLGGDPTLILEAYKWYVVTFAVRTNNPGKGVAVDMFNGTVGKYLKDNLLTWSAEFNRLPSFVPTQVGEWERFSFAFRTGGAQTVSDDNRLRWYCDTPAGNVIDVDGIEGVPLVIGPFEHEPNDAYDTPVTRFKPDMVAPEGANTTFFGQDLAFDPDSFPNFFGTSASATHAAAVAALLLDVDPGLTPLDVHNALILAALDIEEAGVDPLSGAGLIQAPEAAQLAECGLTGPQEVSDLVLDQVFPGSPLVALSWQATAGADAYSIYRGGRADLADLGCFAQGIVGTTTQDDAALPPDLFFYLVTATDAVCESPLGFGSNTERLNYNPCP